MDDKKDLSLAGLRASQLKSEDEEPTLADRLVKQYKAMKEPSSGFAWLFESPEKAVIILRAIKRQVEWNAGHDGQTPPFYNSNISPYHEALSTMWKECPRFENVGMFELFIDEFVQGIKARNPQAENNRALAAFIASQKAWEEREYPNLPSAFYGCGFLTQTDMDNNKLRLNPELRGHDNPLDDRVKRQQDAFIALRTSYLRSFVDYYLADADKAGISSKSTDRASQARYIRDTAENLLLAIKALDEKPSDSLCTDLEEVRDISHHHSRRLERDLDDSDGSGGGRRRKRYRTGRGSRSEHQLFDSYRPHY